MIEYRIVHLVHFSKAQEWEAFCLKQYIKDVIGTGCFISYQFTKDTEADGNSVKFAVSFYTESFENLERYQTDYKNGIIGTYTQLFGDKLTSSESVLHVIIKES